MRTTNEIIEDVMIGKKPSHDECYYALQVYRFLLNIDHKQLRDELLKESRDEQIFRKFKAKNSYDRYKSALSVPPKEWLKNRKETGRKV